MTSTHSQLLSRRDDKMSLSLQVLFHVTIISSSAKYMKEGGRKNS